MNKELTAADLYLFMLHMGAMTALSSGRVKNEDDAIQMSKNVLRKIVDDRDEKL